MSVHSHSDWKLPDRTVARFPSCERNESKQQQTLFDVGGHAGHLQHQNGELSERSKFVLVGFGSGSLSLTLSPARLVGERERIPRRPQPLTYLSAAARTTHLPSKRKQEQEHHITLPHSNNCNLSPLIDTVHSRRFRFSEPTSSLEGPERTSQKGSRLVYPGFLSFFGSNQRKQCSSNTLCSTKYDGAI